MGRRAPAPERSPNEQAVVEVLLAGSAITRTELAAETGLSKPTVHGIVGSLLSERLVEQVGKSSGSVGRSATLFRINPLARAGIGIDLGGTKVLIAVSDLTGTIRAERKVPTGPASNGQDLVHRLSALCRTLAEEGGVPWEAIGAVAIGSPGVADPVTGRMDFAGNVPALGDIDLRRELGRELGKPVVLENDVNFAVAGERWSGLAQRSNDVVFISLGTGLGMGILSHGQLRRGATGAAGEIGFLPLGGDPFAKETHALGPLEERLSARGVVAAYGRNRQAPSDPPLTSAKDVFAAAADLANEAARRTVEETAHFLALAISAVQAVLDPERVILGGGIGSNPLLLREVRQRLTLLARQPASVDISALGERAAVLGAVSEALAVSRAQLLHGPSHSTNGR